LVEKSVDAEAIKSSYQKFLRALQEIVALPVHAAGQFSLEEVEFSAEITADGEFKLLGTGVGLEAKGGVKFKLRRNSGHGK